jgi:hypothetical protein
MYQNWSFFSVNVLAIRRRHFSLCISNSAVLFSLNNMVNEEAIRIGHFFRDVFPVSNPVVACSSSKCHSC